MITIKDLGFSYGDKAVLKNITMTLEEGRIYGLLGENGVGKTTLLTLLCGLKAVKAGSIDTDGHNPYDREPSFLADQYYLSDEVAAMNMTALDYAKNYGKFWDGFDMDKFVEIMGVFENDPAQKMNKMSFGQLKKTYISFALACNTKYLFMDEPTNGLDIPAKSQFRKIIARHATEDRTIVISTHQVRDIEFLLDHILCISGSHLQLDKPVQEICDCLCFQQVETGVTPSDCLYSEPSMRGEAVITANEAGVETTLNLELLFNALQVNPEGILRHLQEK